MPMINDGKTYLYDPEGIVSDKTLQNMFEAMDELASNRVTAKGTFTHREVALALKELMNRRQKDKNDK